MSNPLILVVDDEPDIRSLVQEILEDEGYEVLVAGSAEAAREHLAEQHPALMMLDIWMPGEDGISLLKDLRQTGQLDFAVVMMSGHGTVETAVEATRHGAVDFIEKPLSLAKLLLTVEKALAQPLNEESVAASGQDLSPFIGTGAYSNRLREDISKLAPKDDNVLIVGDQSTGKSLIARHLHAQSRRAGGPFILLRCDSLSTANAARELLGENSHGALNSGYLESANGGTLVLEDVEQLPDSAQTLLADALSRNEIRRAGALNRLTLDLRVVATTTADLPELVRRGAFSDPLFRALSDATIECKPLREHPEDLPALLEHFVTYFSDAENLPYRHFTVAAQNRLRNLSWPGNLLELKNLVQRLMILTPHVEVDARDVDNVLGGGESASQAGLFAGLSLDLPLREARTAFERTYMLYQLQLAEGNIGELAKRVGMERTHLYRKLRSLDIDLGKARD